MKILRYGLLALSLTAIPALAATKPKPAPAAAAKPAPAPAAKAAAAAPFASGHAGSASARPELPHEAPHAVESHATERREAGAEHRAIEHREAVREHYEFHGRDVHHFDRAELGRWRGGRWNQSCYGGRCGWWWLSGGQYYFYDRPVYPYPLAVSEVTFLEPVPVAPVAVAPIVAVRPAPPLPIAAAPQFRYYCDQPAGYYPSVPNCPQGFREVGH